MPHGASQEPPVGLKQTCLRVFASIIHTERTPRLFIHGHCVEHVSARDFEGQGVRRLAGRGAA
jgi:hypothetical protein